MDKDRKLREAVKVLELIESAYLPESGVYQKVLVGLLKLSYGELLDLQAMIASRKDE